MSIQSVYFQEVVWPTAYEAYKPLAATDFYG
jgi:hypothetical protein